MKTKFFFILFAILAFTFAGCAKTNHHHHGMSASCSCDSGCKMGAGSDCASKKCGCEGCKHMDAAAKGCPHHADGKSKCGGCDKAAAGSCGQGADGK